MIGNLVVFFFFDGEGRRGKREALASLEKCLNSTSPRIDTV